MCAAKAVRSAVVLRQCVPRETRACVDARVCAGRRAGVRVKTRVPGERVQGTVASLTHSGLLQAWTAACRKGRLEVLRGDASQVRLSGGCRAAQVCTSGAPLPLWRSNTSVRAPALAYSECASASHKRAAPAPPGRDALTLCSAESEAPARLKPRKSPSRRQVVVGDDNSVLFQRSVGAL